MDVVTIKALKFTGKHGYYPSEREKGNSFELDVIAKGHFKQAIAENDLAKTFNYENVAEIAENVFNGPSEFLIETLCYKIGEELFRQSPTVSELIVRIRKLDPPINVTARYAEIEMTWPK